MKIFLGIFLSLLAYRVSSNPYHDFISFDNFSHVNELNSYSVTDIYQDHQGIIWIATINGLNRFDGYEVLSNDWENGLFNELPGTHIDKIAEDVHHNLWLYSRLSHKIFCLDPTRSFYKEFPTPESEILDIKFDGNNIWLLSHDYIFKWLDNQEKFSKYSIESTIGARILFCSGDSIFIIDNKRNWLYNAESDKFIPCQLPNTSILKVLDVIKENPSMDFPAINEISDVVELNPGALWIATHGRGLFLIEKMEPSVSWTKDNMSVQSYLHMPFVKHTINSNSVSSLFKDREGTIWIGNKEQGINQFSIEKNTFKKINYILNDNQRQEIQTVRALTEDKSGNLYVGTQENGVLIFDKEYRFKKKISSELPSQTIRNLRMDSNGLVWIGHYEGLSSLDPKTYTINNSHLEEHRDPEEHFRVYDIKEDKDKILWISFWYKLIKYNPLNGKSEEIKLPKSASVNSTIKIRCLEFDENGNLWIGTENFGLFLYDTNKNEAINVYENTLDKTSLPSINIFNIRCSRPDTLFICSSKGLFFYKISEKRFFAPPVEENLNRHRTYGALEDKKDGLWISTVNGVWYYNFVSDSTRKFDTSDGLLSNEFTKNGLLKKEDGTIVFGSNLGILFFHPDEIRPKKIKPGLLIKRENWVDMAEPFSLSPQEKSFQLEAKVISYFAPQKNMLMYRLSGWETHWNVQSASNPRIYYENFPEGSYTLEVRGFHAGTPGEFEYLNIAIEKGIPFWRSKWVILIIFILVIAITYGIYRVKLKQIQREKDLKLKVYESEIQLLKSQISPHFLLNTLNNIYSLCILDPSKAAKLAINLSKMLRYMLYESAQHKVMLDKEINFLENYVNLVKEKSPNDNKLNFSIEGNIHQQTIVPFLLLSFVENSFKHGDIFKNPQGFVNIRLNVDDINLIAHIQNTFIERNDFEKQGGGIGLENVRKRLELFYPHRHQLNIHSNENVFSVYLMIKIEDK
ncbi:MAG: two-component regulator propeller domain-containing protein [Cyclobacteriaceae bacterium]